MENTFRIKIEEIDEEVSKEPLLLLLRSCGEYSKLIQIEFPDKIKCKVLTLSLQKAVKNCVNTTQDTTDFIENTCELWIQDIQETYLSKKLYVFSNMDDDETVILQIADGIRITVNAEKLQRAITNCTNV